jgi:alpha-glucosidase (family GH31 glycosyl hydrolase)
MKGGSGDIMHNQYPVLWARLNYGLMSSAIPDGDFAFFMRSGYLGSQPYQPVIWAGDQNTDFDPAFGMPTALIAALNMGVSGVPIFTYDIAGYASTSCPPSTKELYFRWTELGCFTPVMRTHRGNNVFQNWNWDSDSDTIQMFKHYATLHVQLFPYIYTYMSRAHELGTPIMQALWLKFYNDPKTAEIDDEYMFGDNMLVAPVIIQGTTTRTLYLPAGEWYPFNGGSAIAGGISVTVDAPMDSIPVFVPAGSIIPMLTQAPDTLIPVTTVTVTTLANVITAQTIRIYPGANGGFTVYDGSVFTLTSSDSGLNAGQGIILTDQNGHTLQPCSFTDSGIVACGIISGATFKVSGSFNGNIIFTLYGIPSNPATNYRIEVF